MLGDGHCDSYCNIQQCGYDMGDCAMTVTGVDASSLS